MKSSLFLTPQTKINSEWIKDVSLKPETIKLPEVNIGEKLQDIGFGNDFMIMTPESTGNKSKNRQVGLHQAKGFCTAKKTESEKAAYRMGGNICESYIG